MANAKLIRLTGVPAAFQRGRTGMPTRACPLPNQWAALTIFLSAGTIDLDNNAAENAVRPICVGRKNWLFLGNDEGGRRLAILYPLVESCRRNDVNPWEYLKDVLVRIGKQPASALKELLPHNWKAARSRPLRASLSSAVRASPRTDLRLNHSFCPSMSSAAFARLVPLLEGGALTLGTGREPSRRSWAPAARNAKRGPPSPSGSTHRRAQSLSPRAHGTATNSASGPIRHSPQR